MQKYKQTKSQMKERERKSFCSSYKMMQINRLIPSLKICALNRTYRIVVYIKYLVCFSCIFCFLNNTYTKYVANMLNRSNEIFNL